MRTIEKNIIKAFQGLQGGHYPKYASGNSYNLSIRDTLYKDGKNTSYKLWSSVIFWYDEENKEYYFSFCGYSSNTTKSRLNAIFSAFGFGGFYQNNYVIYWVNGNNKKEIDTDKKYKIVTSGSSIDIVEV